jgi:hypothetical protein
MLGVIDGNHALSYVRDAFDLVRRRLSVRGVVCFHDYGFDLPQVTKEIHLIVDEHAAEIARLWVEGMMMLCERGAT